MTPKEAFNRSMNHLVLILPTNHFFWPWLPIDLIYNIDLQLPRTLYYIPLSLLMIIPAAVFTVRIYREQNVGPINELPGRPRVIQETNGANQYKLKQLVMIDNAAGPYKRIPPIIIFETDRRTDDGAVTSKTRIYTNYRWFNCANEQNGRKGFGHPRFLRRFK